MNALYPYTFVNQGGHTQVKVKFPVFSIFPVFFQHKNNTILINKWPPPPLQPSFSPFYYIKLHIQAQEID